MARIARFHIVLSLGLAFLPGALRALTVQGAFEGTVTSSYDHLGTTFGIHGSGHQVGWRIVGSFAYATDPKVTDQSSPSDTGLWYDPARATEWVQISFTLFDGNGVDRGTFAPTSPTSYAPPASVSLDQLAVDDHQETAENGFSDDPTETFSLRDSFSSPNIYSSPPPDVYTYEEVAVFLLGSHFHQDFVTGDGLRQAFVYDRDTWTFGDGDGSYEFIDKIADTGTVSDYAYRFSGDFVLDTLVVAVPEPATDLLVAAGALALLWSYARAGRVARGRRPGASG